MFKNCFIIIISFIFINNCTEYRESKIPKQNKNYKNKIRELYFSCRLRRVISFNIFYKAITGKKYIPGLTKMDLIVIIDFTKSSAQKRFFVIDLANRKLLYKTYVAHGKNTGTRYAQNFSNQMNSLKSSLGFYITAETYNGKNGYSLKLDGLEKNINHNARKRDIVIHSAYYITERYIKNNKIAGHSWGCFSLPPEITSDIINLIKEGCTIFVYANNKEYFLKSNYIE